MTSLKDTKRAYFFRIIIDFKKHSVKVFFFENLREVVDQKLHKSCMIFSHVNEDVLTLNNQLSTEPNLRLGSVMKHAQTL